MWLLIIAGFGTGFFVGLTGIGGGAMMTPMLMLIFGIAPKVAVGTDLWFASLTKLAITRVTLERGLIDWKIAARLWYGSLPAASLALLWLHYDAAASSHRDTSFLKQMIAGAIIWAGFGIILQPLMRAFVRRNGGIGTTDVRGLMGVVITASAGAFIGALVALTSVGAGALGTVVLMYLYPVRLTPPRLIATEIAHAIPLAILGGLGHMGLGNVSLNILIPLLIGAIPAAIMGTLLASYLSHNVMRSILSAMLLTFGAKLWWIPKV